ncbi:MAG: glycosyltransferase family 4 protein [Nanopusillaceae archaeon]
MKSIIFLSSYKLTTYGGTEVWIYKMANFLAEKGYDVTVISSNRILDKERIKLIDILKDKKFDYIISNREFFNISALKELLESERDIPLYTSDNFALKLSIYFDLIRFHRIIFGSHAISTKPEFKVVRYKYILTKYLLKEFNRREKLYFHVLNSAQKLMYEKLGMKNVYLLPNFIETKYYPFPKENNEFIVLFLARFSLHKGIDILPKIINNVLSKNKEIKFVIVGSGEKYYENIIKELENKYPSNIKYLGFISEEEKRRIISKASIYLLPSRYETGVPTLAIGEAIVSGLPFIGSNIIAFRDLLKYDKKFGYIVKDYDPKAFANKILEIYDFWKNNSKEYFESRKYISKRARELFDIEKIGNQFIQTFLK